MSVSEFTLIERYFTRPLPASGEVVLGIGDDAALVNPPAGQQLAIAIDTLVEGVHFPAHTAPGDIAYKALAVNLSDLAAMGALPRWFTLALTLPASEPAWLEAFAGGLFALAEAEGLALIGGDTTRGPLCVTVQVAGAVPVAGAMRRRGAQAGDGIYVSGTLGDAALALGLVQGRTRLPTTSLAQDTSVLMSRLQRPVPRIQAGQALRDIAHAAIDLSDGLLADLGHILSASGVGADVDCDAIPRSAAFSRWERAQAASVGLAQSLLLAGGDDYELCLCLPPEAEALLAERDTGVSLHRIGTVEAVPGLRVHHADGRACVLPEGGGYTHF